MMAITWIINSEAISIVNSKLVLHKEHHRRVGSFQTFELIEKIRGGEISSSATVSNSNIASFGQSLSGQVFSFASVIYGIACSIAPKGCAKLFYGINLENNEENEQVSCSLAEHNRIVFLMKMIGFVTLGLGLTSSFAIASDLELFDNDNNVVLSFYKAIGIGLLPRFLFLINQVLLPTSNVGSTVITKTDLWVCFVETALFLLSIYGAMTKNTAITITPDFPILLEATLCFLFAPILFFRPKLLFDGPNVSKYEKLLTRLLATYLLSSAVLISSLKFLDGTNPHTTAAIEAIGFTALIWVASLVHITFIRKDVLEFKSSFHSHVIMIGIGLAVSTGGLYSFLS